MTGTLCNKVVGIGTPTNNQILKFDSGTDNWEVENESGGGGGSDVKSGTVLNISRGGTATVTFVTAFSSTPEVVVSFNENTDFTSGEKGVTLSVYSISTTGFTVRYDGGGGSGPSTADITWIATDAGNP